MIMSNKTMTRADVSQHVGKLFAQLDANRDGYLPATRSRHGMTR